MWTFGQNSLVLMKKCSCLSGRSSVLMIKNETISEVVFKMTSDKLWGGNGGVGVS